MLDKEYNLRFGMETLSVIKNKHRIDINRVLDEGFDVDKFVTIMRAGMGEDGKQHTNESLMKLIDQHMRVKDFLKIMKDALENDLGVGDDDGDSPDGGEADGEAKNE